MLDDAWIVVVFAGDLNEETLRLVFRYGLQRYYLDRTPPPPSAGTTKSQRRVGTCKRPPQKNQN